MLTDRAHALGINFAFIPVAGLAEDLDLRALVGADNACVVVNAALAMGALFDPAPDLV